MYIMAEFLHAMHSAFLSLGETGLSPLCLYDYNACGLQTNVLCLLVWHDYAFVLAWKIWIHWLPDYQIFIFRDWNADPIFSNNGSNLMRLKLFEDVFLCEMSCFCCPSTAAQQGRNIKREYCFMLDTLYYNPLRWRPFILESPVWKEGIENIINTGFIEL